MSGSGKSTQAERVLAAFGGARKLAKALKEIGRDRDTASIYRWTYTKEKCGTGGVVPTSAWEEIFEAAKWLEIEITPQMLDPRPLNHVEVRVTATEPGTSADVVVDVEEGIIC